MRYRVVVLWALSSLAIAQNFTVASRVASTEQVLYVADTSNLYTYDIDPKTLEPSLMGTIPLPKTQLNAMAVTVDGKFLYLMAGDPYPATDNRIYVYNTTGYGVPGMPLQSVAATTETSMFVDPTGEFLYTERTGATNPRTETQRSFIYRYQIDPATGELSDPVNEASYVLPVQGTNYCGLSIAGMNEKGTEIYDYVFCSTHEGADGTLDEREVTPSTGALGPPQQILSWGTNTLANPDSVQPVKNLVFEFAYPIPNQPYNQLLIYPLSPDLSKPWIDCTATMLAACGSDAGVVHPSARYVFYTDSAATTFEVDRVDWSSKQIVSTGTTFTTPQADFLTFSPDGSVVYGWEYTTNLISILGFDAATAGITTGGSISQSNIVLLLAAERY